MQTDERALQDRLMAERSMTARAEQTALESRQAQLSARLTELDTLLAKLYEEMLLGQLPRDVVLNLSARYTAEKSEKQAELDKITMQLQTYRDAVEDIDKWVTLLKEHLSGRALDWILLHKLIKEIKIGHYTKVNGVKHQDIAITYSFE